MKNSIQKRLLTNFMIVVFIVVLILEVCIIYGSVKISYQNMKRIMADNLDYAMNTIIFRSDSLDLFEILDPSFRQYFDNNTAQVQIIDNEGRVLFDSLGVFYDDKINYPDIAKAASGERGVWVGKVDYSDDKVMAMSVPIINSINQNIGVLRMIIELESIDRSIVEICTVLLFLGIIAILVAYILSLKMSKSIIKPLEELSDSAMKIADGQYKIRSSVDTHDEIEQVSDSINHMADELIKRDELKNDFISSVSHELRTPLTSIKGWAITLQNVSPENEEIKQEGLKIIESEADRLSDMVEELLDFSRYSSGKITLEKEEIDVKEFLDDIISQMKPAVAKSSHIFSIDMAEDLGTMIVDENRLKQVFINIFDNAIKFTNEPGVISLFVRRNKQNQIIFGIKDTGQGISKDDLKKVKEKFFKGNLGQSHVGLGLSISDEIIKLHGGTLEIESEENKGTLVTIMIPADSLGDKK